MSGTPVSPIVNLLDGSESPSPSPTFLIPTASTAVYDNDLIMSEIVFWLFEDEPTNRYNWRPNPRAPLSNMLLVDRRGFRFAAAMKYRNIGCNLLERLVYGGCSFRHLRHYLEAVRTFIPPQTSHYFPTDLSVTPLRIQYPNLRYIRFALPHCREYSTLQLYEVGEVAGGSEDGEAASPVIGHLELVLDSNAAGNKLNIFDAKVGVHGLGAMFHLTGLILGNCYTAEERMFLPGYTYWPTALAPLLSPVGNAAAEKPEARWRATHKSCWPNVFRHLRSLAVCCGGTVEQLAYLANSAPHLQSLSLHFKAVPEAEPVNPPAAGGSQEEDEVFVYSYSVDGDHQHMTDGDGTPKRFFEHYIPPSGGLNVLDLTIAGDVGFQLLDDIAARNLAPICHFNWNMGEVTTMQGGEVPSGSWRKAVQQVQWKTEPEVVNITLGPVISSLSPWMLGTVLNGLIRPSLPVCLVDTEDFGGEHWHEHVRQARLEIIEQDRKYKPRGYRLLRTNHPSLEATSGVVDSETLPAPSPVTATFEAWRSLSEDEKAQFAIRTCFGSCGALPLEGSRL